MVYIYKCIVIRSVTYLCMFNLIAVLCDISAFILLDTWQAHFSATAELDIAKPGKKQLNAIILRELVA